jgi:hypothetical protein
MTLEHDATGIELELEPDELPVFDPDEAIELPPLPLEVAPPSELPPGEPVLPQAMATTQTPPARTIRARVLAKDSFIGELLKGFDTTASQWTQRASIHHLTTTDMVGRGAAVTFHSFHSLRRGSNRTADPTHPPRGITVLLARRSTPTVAEYAAKSASAKSVRTRAERCGSEIFK